MKNDNDYAVVVGIDDYPAYRSLKGAVNDAKDFAAWLCDQFGGGGLPPENCKTVYSVTNPLAPLQQQVDEAFKAILRSVPIGKRAHRLYIYFSGHGMAESNLITDLCLAHWEKEYPNRALDAQEYLATIMALGKFDEIAMFLDCCRVRQVSARGHFPDFNAPSPAPKAGKARFFTANATEYLNPSFEAATSTSSDTPLVRGYFTRVLMSALRGGAAVKKGGVPASQLKNYIEENVPELAKKDGYTQDPEVINGLKGDPLFGSAPPTPPAPPSSVTGTPPGPPPPVVDQRGISRPPRTRFPLTLHDYIGAQVLTILDNKNKEVFRGPIRGKREFNLRSGSYKIRTQFNHVTIETPLHLDRPISLTTREQLPAAPELYTAAPLQKSPISHEYYTVPSEQWSHQTTSPPLAASATSSLFIFIRAIARERHDANTHFGKNLFLLDHEGRQISDLSESVTRSDAQLGWLAFHVAAPEGVLYLRFTGEPVRELPIHLFPGWQTQLFFMHRGKPLLETMKVLLSRPGQGFRPNDLESEAADVALNGLQSNQDLLSENALRLLLHGKFDNPMFGLVAAHVLLKRQRALERLLFLENRGPNPEDKKQKEERQRTIKVVLHNLSRLIPGSPDIAALNLLAGSLAPSSAERKFTFTTPPWLLPGLMGVIEEAVKRPLIIFQDSIIPRIAPLLYVDTPWSTWRPLSEAKGKINWVHIAVLDYARKAFEPGNEKMRRRAVPQLADHLRLPQQTLVHAVRDLQTAAASTLRQSLPNEYADLIGFDPQSQVVDTPVAQLVSSVFGRFTASSSAVSAAAASAARRRRAQNKRATTARQRRLFNAKSRASRARQFEAKRSKRTSSQKASKALKRRRLRRKTKRPGSSGQAS
jgi:hypothetical protein